MEGNQIIIEEGLIVRRETKTIIKEDRGVGEETFLNIILLDRGETKTYSLEGLKGNHFLNN